MSFPICGCGKRPLSVTRISRSLSIARNRRQRCATLTGRGILQFAFLGHAIIAVSTPQRNATLVVNG